MAYTTVENVRKVMRKLPSSITDEDILYHMEQAEALIDAKLRGTFQLPLIPVPPLLEKITVDITIFFLAESLYSSNMPNLDEYQEKRYERAMEWLEGLIVAENERLGSDYATTNDEQIFTYEDPEW
jgi:phage gp36-like protein